MTTRNPVYPFDAPAPLPAAVAPQGASAKIRALLTPQLNAARIEGFTSEQRALYDRIRNQRDKLDPVEFSLVATIREMRQNG